MIKYDRLSDLESEDFNEALGVIENSFGFKFGNNELENVQTFGELVDIIKSKLNLTESNDCTTQQAFYKIRSAIALTMKIDAKLLTTESTLDALIPKNHRRSNFKLVQDHLGFRINALKPNMFVTIILRTVFLGSIILLFFNWKIGLTILIGSIFGFWIADKLGKTFKVKTLGELAGQLSYENYVDSRRDSTTHNPNELENKIKDIFTSKSPVKREYLTRDARFC